MHPSTEVQFLAKDKWLMDLFLFAIIMLRGGNTRSRPAIFIWFVFAQSFFKFHKNGYIRKLQAWSFRLWKNDFCTLYNERPKAFQSSITFSYTPCIAKIYLFSFVETPRKFIIAELSVRKLASSSVLIINLFMYLFIFLRNNKFTWCFHKAKQLYNIAFIYYERWLAKI